VRKREGIRGQKVVCLLLKLIPNVNWFPNRMHAHNNELPKGKIQKKGKKIFAEKSHLRRSFQRKLLKFRAKKITI
jgi:hypothetical protein